MKAYCKNCQLIQPSSFRLGKDAITGSHYEDLCCDSCHFIAATIQEREAPARVQGAQEPVAVPVGYWHKGSGAFFKGAYLTPAQEQMRESGVIKPLYTTPPAAQRTWVGLTDEKIAMAWPYELGQLEKQFALNLEAKLKELNT